MTPLNREKGTAEAPSLTHPAQRYVIRRLRKLIPDHPISWIEAERIACAQATRLVALSRQADLDPAHFVATLPVVRVSLDSPVLTFRTSYWDEESSQWVIVVNAGLTGEARQLTILQEFKRILDHGNESRLYDPRYPHGNVQAEMACDLFATSAFLPAAQVRAAMRQRNATISDIARLFGITRQRARLRLSDLNLTQTEHLERRKP